MAASTKENRAITVQIFKQEKMNSDLDLLGEAMGFKLEVGIGDAFIERLVISWDDLGISDLEGSSSKWSFSSKTYP